MGKVFERMSDEDKLFVRTNWFDFKGETRLLAVSVRECMARVLTRHPNEERRIERYRDEIREELRKSQILADKRSRKYKVSDVPDQLSIYAGTVTASLLQMNREDHMKNAFDEVSWTHDDDVRKFFGFQDIEILSAIYTAINSACRDDNGFADVKAQDVFSLMHPANNYDYYKKDFIETLNRTIDKFDSLHGVYTEHYVRDNGKRIYNQSYGMDSENCFFFACTKKFDEDGDAVFAKSVYQNICERQKRLLSIDTSLLKGDTYEQDIMLAYLVYRHEQKNKNNQTIKLETMKQLLGLTYSDMFGANASVLKKIIRKKLTPLFKNVDVDAKKLCITWRRHEEED